MSDNFYKDLDRLVDLAYGPKPLRDRAPDASLKLAAANTMPEPDIANAERHELDFGGGMMVNMPMATLGGMHSGMAGTINGVAAQAMSWTRS